MTVSERLKPSNFFWSLTIKQCINDEPAVLLHEVVDVTEDSTKPSISIGPFEDVNVDQSLPHDGQ